MVKEDQDVDLESGETQTSEAEVQVAVEPVPAVAVEKVMAPQIQSGMQQDSVIEKKLDTLIESYEKNKLLSIDDIYRKFGLETDVKRTVFMADIYMKALPENLPVDIKRESVHNIMNASEIKIDDLLNDAYKRIDSLNNVLEGVVATTEELRVKQIATIKDLEKRIEELKRTMMERDKFQDTQNTTIEYEIQRVINIVDFVKPKK
jgi:predicted transcriptional regulator